MGLKPIHRDTDGRSCGAETNVVGNTTVFANSKLVSVDGDPNTHGGGGLNAACNQVYVHSKMVVNHSPDGAAADLLCSPFFPTHSHCSPKTAQGSGDVFVGD
jgi:hypothetical protein